MCIRDSFSEHPVQVLRHGKRLITLGNLNKAATARVFPLLRSGAIWFGAINGRAMFFDRPDGTVAAMGNTLWFTNLQHGLKPWLPVHVEYVPGAYTFCDNGALNVGGVAGIPRDYAGVMAVPISFLPYWNPEQFELLGQCAPMADGRRLYRRILIRHCAPSCHRGGGGLIFT